MQIHNLRPGPSQLFSGNKLTSRGASLSFISPEIKNGSSVAKLDKSEVEKLSEFWARALIMYVVGETPTIGAIMRYIATAWGNVAKPRVFLHDAGYFVVHFATMDDRNEVLFGGPHSFNSKPIIVKHWTPDFYFHKEVLRVIPIWVRFPNLPLNCWTPDSLSRVGSLLGVPLFADECTTKQLRVSFARILIELDVTKTLPSTVAIEDPNGRVIAQPVTYDWLPPFCKKCNRVGHMCADKPPGKQVPKRGKTSLQWVPKAQGGKQAEPEVVSVVEPGPQSNEPEVVPAQGTEVMQNAHTGACKPICKSYYPSSISTTCDL